METDEARILRKADAIRRSFIQSGLVVSPDPEWPLAMLPAKRQEKWLQLARVYIELFYD